MAVHIHTPDPNKQQQHNRNLLGKRWNWDGFELLHNGNGKMGKEKEWG